MGKFMTKKQLGMTILLIGLIIVLYGAQLGLSDKLKSVSFTANNINGFKEFKINETNYCYSLPDNWAIEEKKYPGNYIVDHKDLKSEELGIIGYVQILNTDKDGEDIARDDKTKISSEVEKYEAIEFEYKGKEGIKVTYKEKLKAGKNVMSVIYYVELEEDRIIKIHFNIDEKKYKDNFNDIFEAIIDSINKK